MHAHDGRSGVKRGKSWRWWVSAVDDRHGTTEARAVLLYKDDIFIMAVDTRDREEKGMRKY